MMKKAIFILFVLCFLFVTLCGCNQNEEENKYTDRLVTVYGNDMHYLNIIVDTETGVMYLYVDNGNDGGLTVMVDKDGKPLIWESEGEG